MSNKIKIDARAAGYEGEPVRIMAVTIVDSGKILIAKKADWREKTTPIDDVVVVTDTPQVFDHWSMAFYESENIKDLLKTYLEVKRSGLLAIDDSMRMYNPDEIVQMSKLDERGQVLEFDTNVTNGHVAVLLAIWGARQSYAGNIITERVNNEADNLFKPSELDGYNDNGVFDPVMPFSVW